MEAVGKWAYLVYLHRNKILNIDSLILRQKSLLRKTCFFFHPRPFFPFP